MAVFENNPDEWQRLDWQILQNGWTSLYWQEYILNNDLDWFKKEEYNIIDFDCTKWTDTNQVHKDLKKQLDFPDYYGENLSALNDCLSDVEINEPGLVIVFRHFHIVHKDIAHSLLDIFARNSRLHNLFGKRLLTLVQVDNPNYQIDPIGSSSVVWNGTEWLDSKRIL
ncbi:MAG: barstar family protein [Ferruginibacter sp.]|jgi:RNAse (barnase) inhibitor barstar